MTSTRLVLVGLLAAVMIATSTRAHALAVESPRATVSLGTSLMLEKNTDGRTPDSRLPFLVGAGVNFRPFAARVEYSRFSTGDGSAAVAVRRDFESILAWASVDFLSISMDGESVRRFTWNPYAAVGFGFARTQSETRFMSTSERATSIWGGAAALALGAWSRWTPDFAVRPEFRYETPLQEAIGTAGNDSRIGLSVQAEYLF